MKRTLYSRLAMLERQLEADKGSDLFHMVYLQEHGLTPEEILEKYPPMNPNAWTLIINISRPPADQQGKQVSEAAEIARLRKQLKEKGWTDEQIRQAESGS